MAILITYDVPSKHTELKKTLFSMGYVETIPYKDESGKVKTIYLPNTTVYHASKTAQQGRDDLETVCSNLNIKLERLIATQWGPNWAAIYGEPFGK